MKDKKLPRPTETELEILRALWVHGPSTVRQIHNALNAARKNEVGYSTTLKMFQVMTQKGLLDRDESERPQVYSTRLRKDETQKQLVTDLLDRAFGGSAKQLVLNALPTKRASEKDLEQLERLLDKIEGKRK